MEPITAIVTALAVGAAAGLKQTGEQMIKDGYGALKMLIQRRYTKVNLSLLEESPESQNRRAVIEEDLIKSGAHHDEELLLQAKKLLDMVYEHAPESASTIGVDLEDIKAASLRIADVTATGTGVKARNVTATGDIDIRGVRAGYRGDDASKKV